MTDITMLTKMKGKPLSRIFNQLRTAIMSEMDIRLEIERIKRSLDNHDKNIELEFQYLDELNDKMKRPPLSPDTVMVGIRSVARRKMIN